MSRTDAQSIPAHASWRDYLELTKPRVVALIVLTAVVGTLLATPGLPPLDALVFGNLGIALAVASMSIFAWTPPHFWALAIARRHDYARADIPMLPVTHGVEFTRLHVLLYTVILCVVTMLPFMIGMSGLIYLAAALVLNGRFLWQAIALKRARRDDLPMRMFRFSISYLMWLFLALLLDHYLPTTQG
jgi:protoheme IX farnesyltransferase